MGVERHSLNVSVPKIKKNIIDYTNMRFLSEKTPLNITDIQSVGKQNRYMSIKTI